MSEEMLIRHCSPTLAGLKTANLFTSSYHDKAEIFDFLRKWNTQLHQKGIRLLPLQLKRGKALIYVYRPSQLSKDLSDGEVREMLCSCGYCTDSCEKCIARLIRRLHLNEEFPHEIGLFLGYPVEDVKGFIENKADCAKCVGCWKVYGDREKAQKQFERFKKCTRIYQKQWADGIPLTKLTVSR